MVVDCDHMIMYGEGGGGGDDDDDDDDDDYKHDDHEMVIAPWPVALDL